MHVVGYEPDMQMLKGTLILRIFSATPFEGCHYSLDYLIKEVGAFSYNQSSYISINIMTGYEQSIETGKTD